MESSVALLPHPRSRLPTRTYRSLLHRFCSSFDQEPRICLATPAVLQELVLRTEITQVPPGEICRDENPPENLSVVESRCDGVSGDSRGEKVETISHEKSLMLGDVFDGIDLQDASVGYRQKDFFDDFELMINESEDFAPESCLNLFEELDMNDFAEDCMVPSLDDIAKQPLEKRNTATELQVDPVEGDKMVSESKPEEVPKSVEADEVRSSGLLETCREMKLDKPVSNTVVLAASLSLIVEDVEEGEISGDENDDMLIGDDLAVKRHDESHVSQEVFDKGGEGTSNSRQTNLNSFGHNLFCGVGSLLIPKIVEEKGQRQIGKKLGVEVSDVDNRAKDIYDEEKMDLGTCIKKKSERSKEAKARKKAKSRKKRAQERIALGVKKLKLKPVAPKPKPIKYCRHYLKGRCHEGEKCKFSHDTTPETKFLPCCYFATQSCMKGDVCPYDHDLSKYPCNNFITKGFCHRGDNCLFSHKGTPQSGSDTRSANVTTSSTNIAAASLSPQKTNKQTVREAIAKLPAIQARVSSTAAFLRPSSQSAASSTKVNEHVTPPQIPPLRKPSIAPKGMSFLCLDKTSQEEHKVKPSPASKQNTHNSDDQSFIPLVPPKGMNFLSFASDEGKAPMSREPQEPANGRNLKTRPNSSHIQTSLNSAMKLAAELESVKVERRTNDPTEAVNKGNITVNTSVTRNSGNISSKILEFLSSFSDNNMKK